MANASIFVAPIGSKTDGSFKRARNPILVWSGTGPTDVAHIGSNDPATEGFNAISLQSTTPGAANGNFWEVTGKLFRIPTTVNGGDWSIECDITPTINGGSPGLGFIYDNSSFGKRIDVEINMATNMIDFDGQSFNIGPVLNQRIQLKVVHIATTGLLRFYINNTITLVTAGTGLTSSTIDVLDVKTADNNGALFGDCKLFTAIQEIQL